MSSSSKPDYSKFTDADVQKMEQMSTTSANALLIQAGLLPVPSPPSPTSTENPKSNSRLRILDNACGAGIVTSLFLNALANDTSNVDVHVTCADFEPQMVKLAKQRIEKNGWNERSRAEAVVADAQALPFADNQFTHVLMNMGIQVVPDPALVVKESLRVISPSGVFGITSASTPGWLPLIQSALGTSFTPPPMFTSGPLLSPASITTWLTEAGFTQVEVKTLSFETTSGVEEHLVVMRRMLGGEGGMLEGEMWERYEGYVRERFGQGEVRMRSEMFVTTARKA
ncbi:Methyltransf-25 domain-containing protein [Favolaschia claudopus]|uniref:Methyltransf-25 domain-containing protein n=1 Tax=Favolaschia claudopus TaxID=2862362 RepID=A0AAV9ZF82_9AGAR